MFPSMSLSIFTTLLSVCIVFHQYESLLCLIFTGHLSFPAFVCPRQCRVVFLCNLVTEFSPAMTVSLVSITKTRGWTGMAWFSGCWSNTKSSPSKVVIAYPEPSCAWGCPFLSFSFFLNSLCYTFHLLDLFLFVSFWCNIRLMDTKEEWV